MYKGGLSWQGFPSSWHVEVDEVSTIEELSDLRDFLKSVPGELTKLSVGVHETVDLVDMVEELRFQLPGETLDARWKMFAAPGKVTAEVYSGNFRSQLRDITRIAIELVVRHTNTHTHTILP